MEKQLPELSYQEWPVDEHLKEHAMLHWHFEAKGQGEPFLHLTPPTASLGLLYIDTPYYKTVKLTAVGLEMRHIEVPTPARFLGFRFHPAALPAFFPDIDLKELLKTGGIDLGAPWTDLLPLIAEPDSHRKVEQMILAQFQPDRCDSDMLAVARYLQAQDGQVRVQELPRRFFLSERQLQRRFKAANGVSIKVMARLHRLMESFEKVLSKEMNIKDAVYQLGYFDQAHFTREMQKFAQRSPKEVYKYYRQIEADLLED